MPVEDTCGKLSICVVQVSRVVLPPRVVSFLGVRVRGDVLFRRRSVVEVYGPERAFVDTFAARRYRRVFVVVSDG